MAHVTDDRQRYLEVQGDWHNAEDTFWLNVYERSVMAPSLAIHTSPRTQLLVDLKALPHENDATKHVVEMTKRESNWIELQVKQPHEQALRSVFQAPNKELTCGDGLFALDVSPDEHYVVAGGRHGGCTVWNIGQATKHVQLSGHMMDVTSARFFPSSKVVLTGSLDFKLRIWSVDNGRCAAVLEGHLGGIEDTVIVGRGRNVLSCGSDGLIQLWSCGSQQGIAKWATDDRSAVHCMSLLTDGSLCAPKTLSPDAEEFETDDKVLFAGLDNGEVLGVDIRARESVANIDVGGAVLSCATAVVHGVPMLVTGTEKGIVSSWDLRHTQAPLSVVSRSTAEVRHVMLDHVNQLENGTPGVWTAHGDGACSYWHGLLSQKPSPRIVTDLTGPTYEPVRRLAMGPRTGRVFTACRDGQVREYIPHVSV
ncbi:TPA: hypothetical protein N0F65_008803 [Lagenidium giganteum]|uniref:Proteasomal ATPase-associated factor 1 n=1 Tax=Lagenidium giganteum TaxID=4803 RepID=A0AAV2YUG2_9STRA|nr:TPA: hypothetical protein N0F65_008803 [Lagenidium giganteum]